MHLLLIWLQWQLGRILRLTKRPAGSPDVQHDTSLSPIAAARDGELENVVDQRPGRIARGARLPYGERKLHQNAVFFNIHQIMQKAATV